MAVNRPNPESKMTTPNPRWIHPQVVVENLKIHSWATT